MSTFLTVLAGAALALGGFLVAVLVVWPRLRRWWASRPTPAHAVDQGADRLTRWEEAALLATGAASAFNVLLWSLGFGLADALPAWTPLGVLRVAFSVLSFVSMDLVVIVTVMAMRAGRRGFWSELCSGAAALAAAGIALEVAGVVAWPWLHAAPMVVLYTFMRHLAAPRVAQPARELARERDELRAEVAQLRDSLDHAADRWVALTQEADQARFTADDLRTALGQAAAEADHWRAMAAQAAQRPALTADHDTVTIGGRSYSTRDAAQALGISKTTLGRKLAQLDQGE